MRASIAERKEIPIEHCQDAALRMLRNLRMPGPKELFDLLDKRGYCGQAEARKALCLFAYRHVRRLQHIHICRIPRETLPPKTNLLLMGPTGCGKTYLIEQLFKELLGLPTLVVDVTMLSETGYVGQDPCTVLTQLVHVADDNPALAETGIVCLDEFDKLATANNNGVFSGAGTTKDITGRGVQRELLKMLESSELQVPVEMNTSIFAPRLTLSTRDIAFIGCGAFSGFKQVAEEQKGQTRLGFGQTISKQDKEFIQARVRQYEAEDLAAFQHYGFMPELIGRFSRIIPFEPLAQDTLERIVRTNFLPRYIKEFALEGIKLRVADAFVTHLANEALRRKTGARGIAAAFTHAIEEIAFDRFDSNDKRGEVCIDIKKGEIEVS